jgi:hypothetical protein
MRQRLPVLVIVAFGLLEACGASRKLSEATAKQSIRQLGLADFKDQQIQIQRVIQAGEDHAVVEANLQMAFRLSKTNGQDWEVNAIRMGDRNWIDVKSFLSALDEVRARETRESLLRLQEGIRKYQASAGALPQAADIVKLTDLLYPAYMPEVLRYDGWNHEFVVKSTPQDVQIISAGPDGIPGNADDIRLDNRASGGSTESGSAPPGKAR